MLHEQLTSQIRKAMNGDDFEWDTSIPFNWAVDFFDYTAPDLPALFNMNDNKTYTYGDLSRQSNIYAHHFASYGLNDKHCAMLVIENSPDYYFIALALIKLNIFFVPCSSQLSKTDLIYRKSVINPNLIITDNEKYREILELDDDDLTFVIKDNELKRIIHGDCYLEDVNNALISNVGFNHISGNAPMMGTFTSGSSGLPKLAVHSHTSWPVGHLSSVAWQGINRNDLHLNIAHTGWAKHAWSSFFVPFNVGACVAIPNQECLDPSKFSLTIQNSNISSICAPPSFWRSVIKNGLPKKPERLSNITSAGEKIDFTSMDTIKNKWGLTLRNGYGQSEATAMIGDMPNGDKNSILPGYHNATLLDGESSDEGILGFPLEEKPVGVMLGYKSLDGNIKHPNASWFITGDRCKKLSNQHYELIGRNSLSFKSYDYLISPEEVEEKLLTSGLVSETFVYRDHDIHNEPVPSILVIPVDDKIGIDQLKNWINAHFSSIYRFNDIRIVEKLAKNISGKIDRKAILEALQ